MYYFYYIGRVYCIIILGIGDWGLGIGPNPQSPIPNPQNLKLNINIRVIRNTKINKTIQYNNYLKLHIHKQCQ